MKKIILPINIAGIFILLGAVLNVFMKIVIYSFGRNVDVKYLKLQVDVNFVADVSFLIAGLALLIAGIGYKQNNIKDGR